MVQPSFSALRWPLAVAVLVITFSAAGATLLAWAADARAVAPERALTVADACRPMATASNCPPEPAARR